jgi:hypothetical protein
MIKKIGLLVAIAAAAGVAVTVAQASTPKSHPVQQTGVGSGLYHYPFGGPKNSNTNAATLGTTGAVIDTRIPNSSVCPTSFAGTVTVFEPQGKYSGTITKGTITQQPGCNPMSGPPTKVTEKVKITRGSGLYKGATGSVTITYTYESGSPGDYKVVVNGTIKY